MASAIFHHAMTAGQAQVAKAAPLNAAAPSTSSTSGTSDSDSSDSSATISANDFLTLLVTEMKNQDPTADTDPNEYINQLVQVNSLEQLIDINQTLSGDVSGSANTTTETTGTPAAEGAGNSTASAPLAGSQTAQIMQALHAGGGTSLGSLGALGQTGAASAVSAHAPGGAAKEHAAPLAGNLGVQKTSPAARRVGHALAGRTHAAAIPTAN
jgi:flagellar basal-body rod modification protein FlgD